MALNFDDREKLWKILSKIMQNVEKSHKLDHLEKVEKNALEIANELPIHDSVVREVQVAALLHEIFDKKLFSIKQFEENKKFLQNALIEIKVDPNRMFQIIESISFSKGIESNDLVIQIVQDADLL